MSGFFQATTAHCEDDAFAHVWRDNPTAESIDLIAESAMEFGNLTMFRYEVTLPPRRLVEVTPYDDTPMFFATPMPVRSKTAAGWA